MRNEYTAPEVVEVGRADDVILGAKDTISSDSGVEGLIPNSDLDD